MLTAFLSFAFNIFFYVTSCGGPHSSSLVPISALYIFIPSIIFSLLASSGLSIVLY